MSDVGVGTKYRCTNRHLLIVNELCEICMGTSGNEPEKLEGPFDLEYYAALEQHLEDLDDAYALNSNKIKNQKP